MKILITGGAGFIGSNFIHYWLSRHQDEIINLDALTYAGNRANLDDIASSPLYKFIQGDICNRETVATAMQGADVVIHFAAETHVDRSILDPSAFVKTNVEGTLVLLQEAIQQKVKRFHHISTDEVFGSLQLNSDDKFSEATKYDPHSPYSASKAGSDHLVRAFGDTYGLSYSITNCSNNYGPYMFPEKFIPLAITNIIEGKKVPVYGDGMQVRDWLFVEDHCSAIEAVITRGKPMSTYCVGGLSQDIPNIEVINKIITLMRASESVIEYVNDRPGHDVRYAIDWSKISNELSWKPSVTFEQGLQKTIDWYVANQSWWKPLKQQQESYFTAQYGK